MLCIIYNLFIRFMEKLDVSSRLSRDLSCMLLSDIDFAQVAGSYTECVKINLNAISPATSAILLLLDGGARNFQHVASVSAATFQVLISPLACLPSRVQTDRQAANPTYLPPTQVPNTAQNTTFADIAEDDAQKVRELCSRYPTRPRRTTLRQN